MNTCVDCGKEIGKTSTRCRSCSNKANAQKNSDGLKKAYREGRRKPADWTAPGHSPRGMASREWREQNPERYRQAIEKQKRRVKGVSKPGHPHSEETKRHLSVLMSERLRDPEKRKNYGRGKKSNMELYFENWLFRNNIPGWESERHFWNDDLKKNYFVDFVFEKLKLIIELDGTQHRLTVVQDRIRDEWFAKQGYCVKRIPIEEFKKGEWEQTLLKQLQAAVMEQVDM